MLASLVLCALILCKLFGTKENANEVADALMVAGSCIISFAIGAVVANFVHDRFLRRNVVARRDD